MPSKRESQIIQENGTQKKPFTAPECYVRAPECGEGISQVQKEAERTGGVVVKAGLHDQGKKAERIWSPFIGV